MPSRPSAEQPKPGRSPRNPGFCEPEGATSSKRQGCALAKLRSGAAEGARAEDAATECERLIFGRGFKHTVPTARLLTGRPFRLLGVGARGVRGTLLSTSREFWDSQWNLCRNSTSSFTPHYRKVAKRPRRGTAGLPISCTVGRRHNFCCRGPILIPRPDSETSAQTTRVNVLDFFVKL